jgi:tryptophanase
MANIKEVRQITQKYEIPLFFDASRFAENAWFIQKNEPGYQEKSIIEIVHEMFSYVDGFHISFKKDGLVNMGGGILIKENSIFTEKYKDFQNKLTDHQILTEGHPTYGGLAGRDLKALAEGLKTVVREDYLTYRIEQVQRFGKKLIELLKDKEGKSPIKQPIGGHAVYIDIDEFFKDTKMKDEDFGGISLTALLLIAGHRLCELGLYTFGKFENGKEIPPSPRVNYVRAAIPRLVYEDQDLFSLAEIISILHKNKDKIPGVEVIYGRDLKLRHFKSRFKFKES